MIVIEPSLPPKHETFVLPIVAARIAGSVIISAGERNDAAGIGRIPDSYVIGPGARREAAESLPSGSAVDCTGMPRNLL